MSSGTKIVIKGPIDLSFCMGKNRERNKQRWISEDEFHGHYGF